MKDIVLSALLGVLFIITSFMLVNQIMIVITVIAASASFICHGLMVYNHFNTK